MTTTQSLALSAASAATAAALELVEYASAPHRLLALNTVEDACHAAKLTIEATYGDEMSEDVGQVYAALCRFLEGE